MRNVAHIEKTHHHRDLAEPFARARDRGFDGVEIVIGRGATCELLGDPEDCHAIRETARRCGIEVLSALLDDDPAVRIGAADDWERSENVGLVRAVVQRCRRLNPRIVRLVPAVVRTEPDRAGQPYQDALNRTCASLEALRGDFERSGVIAGVMPCHHGFLLSPPEFRELLDRVNSPLVGAALDYAACVRVGDPADWISTLQHRLAAMVIDTPAPDDAVVEALRDLRFDGLLIYTGRWIG